MATIKINARVDYVGQSAYNKEDRFAVVNTTGNQDDINIVDALLNIVSESYDFKYDGFGDPTYTAYWIPVDDYNDYKVFMQEWKKAKKIFKERMTFDFSK